MLDGAWPDEVQASQLIDNGAPDIHPEKGIGVAVCAAGLSTMRSVTASLQKLQTLPQGDAAGQTSQISPHAVVTGLRPRRRPALDEDQPRYLAAVLVPDA